jgi:hypothetical protein
MGTNEQKKSQIWGDVGDNADRLRWGGQGLKKGCGFFFRDERGDLRDGERVLWKK